MVLQLSVKSFPKRSDGTTGTAESGGRIEKGDYLVAVNSIRLEGFAFNDAIHLLTTQVSYPYGYILYIYNIYIHTSPPYGVVFAKRVRRPLSKFIPWYSVING